MNERYLLTVDNKKWIKNNFPSLILQQHNGIEILEGNYLFNTICDRTNIQISDSYQIRIVLQPRPNSILPRVFETGARIQKIAGERNIPLADFHFYNDRSACLCIEFDEMENFPNGFQFPDFLDELVKPFFYAQSFFEKYEVWPWPTYSHGFLGYLEWYDNNTKTDLQIIQRILVGLKSNQNQWLRINQELQKTTGIKGHHQCICGSGKNYRKCHNKVFFGLNKFQNDLKLFGLNQNL